MPSKYKKTKLIFDLDDTLIKTTQHYLNTEHWFSHLFEAFNIPANEVQQLIREIDIKLLSEHKYGYHWYAQGLEDAYNQLKTKYKISIKNFKKKLNAVIAKEFQSDRELWDNALEILEHFYNLNYKMYIMTLGDDFIQMEKIEKTNIKHYFEQIFIVPRKDDEFFQKMIKTARLKPEETYFIGNSIENDMLPAKRAGFKCILYNKHTTFYGKKVKIPSGIKIISDLIELKELIK